MHTHITSHMCRVHMHFMSCPVYCTYMKAFARQQGLSCGQGQPCHARLAELSEAHANCTGAISSPSACSMHTCSHIMSCPLYPPEGAYMAVRTVVPARTALPCSIRGAQRGTCQQHWCHLLAIRLYAYMSSVSTSCRVLCTPMTALASSPLARQ
jgi:hypothetical protein